MPAEWERHEATWVAWPHNVEDWPGKFHPIPWVTAEVVKHLSEGEEVRLIVLDENMERKARRILEKADAMRGKISFYHLPTNRCWTRDYLPLFVVSNDKTELVAVKWHFNGWAKYSDWELDDKAGEAVAHQICSSVWYPRHPSTGRKVVLEGGSIDVNGEGLLLTTEECLMSKIQARNPGFSKADYEELFRSYLGITRTIWLAGGIVGDDTHGHVDDVARFVSPDTVVLATDSDSNSPHYEILAENKRRLLSATDTTGRRLNVVELPLPSPVVFAGQRLPASYANFYIGNTKVLVPTFNDPNDRIALSILQDLFPSRTVVGIHCLDFVLGLGTIHCMTQQQPLVGVS